MVDERISVFFSDHLFRALRRFALANEERGKRGTAAVPSQLGIGGKSGTMANATSSADINLTSS
jgi:hypothetical protein